MSLLRRLLLALLTAVFLAVPAGRAAERDPLPDVRERMKIEAERVEKEFAEGRILAYQLVRRDDPRLVEATEKLHELLAMVRADTSVEPRRRAVLLVTLKADLERVRDIAGQRRRFTIRRDDALLQAMRRDTARADETRRTQSARQVSDEARSIIEARSASVADARRQRIDASERLGRVYRSVDEAAIPETRDYRLPKNWAELSMKRSPAAKLTAKEKAMMRALNSVLAVDFNKNTFEEVIDYLRKATGMEIITDRRALEEVSVSYESPVSLRLRASTRTILKRILADLGLAYVIKDEAIQITSRERANQMTTVRSYYLGDLAAVVDIRLPPGLTQLLMMENVNRIIGLITQNVDPQSWKINNADAAGTVVFDPITMTLVVKQTAEVHYMLGGGYR